MLSKIRKFVYRKPVTGKQVLYSEYNRSKLSKQVYRNIDRPIKSVSKKTKNKYIDRLMSIYRYIKIVSITKYS